MDWEDYPAVELAALYKRRWDGSETALREARAPLRGAGPGTGPMLRSGSPDLIRQELAAWAVSTAMTRGVILDAALAAAPARKGRRAGLQVRPRDLSFARAVRAVLSAIRLGHACYQAVTSQIGQYRNTLDRDRHRARKSKSPSSFPHAGPHRPHHHHHGQHPSLTSGNTVNLPETEPCRTVDPAARRDTPTSGMPTGRQLPAVTKNRNYP
jgi:hypothetical protein